MKWIKASERLGLFRDSDIPMWKYFNVDFCKVDGEPMEAGFFKKDIEKNIIEFSYVYMRGTNFRQHIQQEEFHRIEYLDESPINTVAPPVSEEVKKEAVRALQRITSLLSDFMVDMRHHNGDDVNVKTTQKLITKYLKSLNDYFSTPPPVGEEGGVELEKRAEKYANDNCRSCNERHCEEGCSCSRLEAAYIAGANSVRQQGDEGVSELLEKLLGLFERFMPKEVSTDSRKDMAMYEAYHCIKQFLSTQSPSIPQPGFIEQGDVNLRYWNLAITLANNECVRISDEYNNDDHIEGANAATECAKRIREYINNPVPELLKGKGEEGITCVFCEMPCEPVPTKRGWSSVRYGYGLHFDCAGKVADQGNTIDMQEEWDHITNHKIRPYDRDENYVDDMGNGPL